MSIGKGYWWFALIHFPLEPIYTGGWAKSGSSEFPKHLRYPNTIPKSLQLEAWKWKNCVIPAHNAAVYHKETRSEAYVDISEVQVTRYTVIARTAVLHQCVNAETTAFDENIGCDIPYTSDWKSQKNGKVFTSTYDSSSSLTFPGPLALSFFLYGRNLYLRGRRGWITD